MNNWCTASAYYRTTKAHCRKTCGFCTPIVKPVIHRPVTPTVKTTPKTKPKPERACGRDKENMPVPTPAPGAIPFIMNANDARPHQWEWKGGIYYQNVLNDMEFVCGGSLISKNVLLTAAHCAHYYRKPEKRRDPRKMMVKLGDYNRSWKEVGEQSLKVKKMVIHEEYNYKNLHNDIALLQLERDAQITDTVGTVCVADRDIDPRNNPTCYISGWGSTDSSHTTFKLQEAKLPLLTNRVCKKRNRRIIPTMLCGGFKNYDGKVSGCNGDSGGPYVCKSGGRWVQHGIMSWGPRSCNAQHLHTVFTRVSKYSGWIAAKIHSL